MSIPPLSFKHSMSRPAMNSALQSDQLTSPTVPLDGDMMCPSRGHLCKLISINVRERAIASVLSNP